MRPRNVKVLHHVTKQIGKGKPGPGRGHKGPMRDCRGASSLLDWADSDQECSEKHPKLLSRTYQTRKMSLGIAVVEQRPDGEGVSKDIRIEYVRAKTVDELTRKLSSE